MYPLSTLGLEEGGWAAPHPDHLTPVKENWYLLYRRLSSLGIAMDVNGRYYPTGLEPRIAQSVATHYTYYAHPAPTLYSFSVVKLHTKQKIQYNSNRL